MRLRMLAWYVLGIAGFCIIGAVICTLLEYWYYRNH